ncbi:MAG: gliding motility-associated C-terminal domain-containing protein [Saprospiraceae bacterium]|nr:gliding motility-associated C-terminal domain-containing protein [Saprospiraceae bacterium]
MTLTVIFRMFFQVGVLFRVGFALFVTLGFSALKEANAQFPNPVELNTGINTPVGSLDANWLVAYGDTAKATSAFVPAKVVGRCDASWPVGSPPSADWITYDFGSNCHHVSQGCLDLYFQREIILPATNACGVPVEESFCLNMDFFADNSVYQVTVNDVINFQYYNTTNPYNYNGVLHLQNIALCKGWTEGANTLLVHTRSCPTVAGLLAIGKRRNTPPKDFLGKNVVACSGEPVTLSSPFDHTIWFDGTVGKTKTVTSAGDYWAKIMDSEGCEITDTITVTYPVESYVPNAFSPNDDGENDCFSPFFSETNFDTFELSIFDRWGNLVFRTENVADCWDGKSKGKPCAPGVYIYFIFIKSGLCDRVLLSGDLTLFK